MCMLFIHSHGWKITLPSLSLCLLYCLLMHSLHISHHCSNGQILMICMIPKSNNNCLALPYITLYANICPFFSQCPPMFVISIIRGVATGWTGVDMSTPLLSEFIPEIDTNLVSFYAQQRSYSAYMPWQFHLSVCLSVCPSVCHTGGSVKNG